MEKKSKKTPVKKRLELCRGALEQGRESYTVPEIRLTGKWLSKCGFVPDQTLLIIPKRNKLIIKPA